MRRRVASPTETQSLPLMTIGSITGQLPAERTCSVRPARDTRARQTCPARRELAGQPAGQPVCTCVPHVPRLSACCSGTDFVSIPLGDGFGSARGVGPSAQQQGRGAKAQGSISGPNTYQMCREVLPQLGPDGGWDPRCLEGACQVNAEHLPPFWGPGTSVRARQSVPRCPAPDKAPGTGSLTSSPGRRHFPGLSQVSAEGIKRVLVTPGAEDPGRCAWVPRTPHTRLSPLPTALRILPLQHALAIGTAARCVPWVLLANHRVWGPAGSPDAPAT